MSSSFGRIERSLARFLSKSPVLKQIAKRYYSRIVYMVYRRGVKIDTKYKVFEIGEDNEESFFGYYDKSPLNATGNYLIYHSSKRLTAKLPDSNEPIQVILANFINSEIIAKFDSNTYNWQQGTKLQWLDNNNFIFNDFDAERERYISKIVNANSGKIEKIVDFPIYDTYKSFGISLNFDRLAILRPDYGYRNLAYKNNFDLSNLKDDGIFYIDLDNNEQKLLLSLEDIINIEKDDKMDNALHKVNHIMISPNGEKFMFMHRWILGNGKRYDRLLVSDIKGATINILADDEMVSHCCWYGNDSIIGYMKYCSHDYGFYRIDLKTNKTIFLSEKLSKFGDGHPTFFDSRMVFDSYPDRSRMKHLYLYDIEKDFVEDIGNFFEPLSFFGETRCDLHPKWSLDGKSIYIDSVHNGVRKLYKLKI